MSNSDKQQGPEVSGAVTGENAPESAPEDAQKPVEASASATLKVEAPFYYASVVLPDGEDEDGNPTVFNVTRTGTEVPADRADELVEAASALGVTLSRSN